MKAREALFESELFGEDTPKILPIINPNGSDSAMFDNTLELLVLAGRSLPHAMMMMIPEPWTKHESMDADKRAFYQYHSSLMEPWDGPASIAFTDGKMIGAVLDRNGLRPSRYYVTKDDLVIMASEAGVLDVPPEDVVQKGRLQPGRMFLVDTEQGRIIDDEEIKRTVATEHPYGRWLDQHLVHLKDLPRRAGSARIGSGFAAAAADRVRLHLRRSARAARADGEERRRGRRLDGQRHAARCVVEPAALAVRLLQATVRSGDEPAHRLHSRGTDYRLGGVARLGRQLTAAAAGRLPPSRTERAHSDQRGIRQGYGAWSCRA